MNSHYTQSLSYAKYMEKIGWKSIKVDNKYWAYLKSIPLFHGNICKIPRAHLDLNLDQVDQLAKKQQALLVKLEPNEIIGNEETGELAILDSGYLPDKFPICQSKTIRVDLHQSEESLLKSFRPETRHHLRKAWQKNFQIQITPNDGSAQAHAAFESFYSLFEKCAKERHFFFPFKNQIQALWDSFGEKAIIMIVSEQSNSDPFSGTLILTHQQIAYYKYGASIPFGRNQFSSYFLYWQMFLWAKKQGYQVFDLEGIHDPRYHHNRKYLGFTQFKRGWSKNEITYIGPFTKYYAWPLQLFARCGIML